MTVWRPSTTIRVKVLGLVWRETQLMAAEVHDDSGRVKGVRPLGGSVDFGETREQALHREFGEELNAAIAIVGPWQVFENIYEHEGAIGHEIIFTADVELADPALYGRDDIVFREYDGTPCRARWLTVADLEDNGLELYPTGLTAQILPRIRSV